MNNKIIFLIISIVSLTFANAIDENIGKENPPNTNSKIIIGEGAKVIIGTKVSAKLWYDKLILISDAKLVEDEDSEPELSKVTNADKSIEIIEAEEASLPTKLSISKAYPNPFNPVVNISYGLPEAADVKIVIHDLSGRKIAEYNINQQSAGWHEFNWNAVDMHGQDVGTGIYLLTIQAGDKLQKQKITYIK